MAFQAHQVYLAALQQPRIIRSVRCVACCASFRLEHRMLENKGARLIGVALVANCVVRRSSAQLPCVKSAMRIVAVRTLNQSFVYAMVKGPRKLLTHFQMAAVTKLWLLLFHQVVAFLGVMRIVAIGAADIVLQVRGAPKIGVFGAVLMAT